MKCKVFQGDITQLEVDAIVNAANSSLLGGGGVDGAIHAAAGPDLMVASRELAPCPPGNAVLTEGFDLLARFVIHAVGPIYRSGKRGEADLLKDTYLASLQIANEKKLNTVAFPCISTGAYRFPKKSAAIIAIKSTAQWQVNHEYPRLVIFCCFDSENSEIYSDLIHQWQQTGDHSFGPQK